MKRLEKNWSIRRRDERVFKQEACFGCIRSAWFLQENMLPGLDAAQRPLVVETVRKSNVDAVHRGII